MKYIYLIALLITVSACTKRDTATPVAVATPIVPQASGCTSVKTQGLNYITVKQGNDLFHRYYKTAQPLNEIFRGFTVNQQQLKAMQELLLNPDVKNFRIYKCEGGTLVIGVNTKNQDIGDGCYLIQEPSEPCPIYCDESIEPVITYPL